MIVDRCRVGVILYLWDVINLSNKAEPREESGGWNPYKPMPEKYAVIKYNRQFSKVNLLLRHGHGLCIKRCQFDRLINRDLRSLIIAGIIHFKWSLQVSRQSYYCCHWVTSSPSRFPSSLFHTHDFIIYRKFIFKRWRERALVALIMCGH